MRAAALPQTTGVGLVILVDGSGVFSLWSVWFRAGRHESALELLSVSSVISKVVHASFKEIKNLRDLECKSPGSLIL